MSEDRGRRLIGGRFAASTGADMERYSSSIAVDLKMAAEDVAGSIAHVTMLGEVGILEREEAAELCARLKEIEGELADGRFRPEDADEDIHMAIERRLLALAGEVGGKVHVARSRNDQVATDVRLWLKRRLGELDEAVRELVAVLLERVERDGDVLIPGYTHLQRGQPILLGHHLLGHVWPLARDRERLAAARARLDRCPLGAGALAGTPHPIDRWHTARLLGFAGPVENALDAVAARDHEQEVAAACAIAMGHLSRMAEELVLWSMSEIALVRIDEAYATGSSIMPQKRNPDAAELVRGKTARVFGALHTLLVLTKGLPMSYNRDLQEDREALFDVVETTRDSLRIMAGMWRTLEVDRDRFEDELRGDFSLATELADYLVERGEPFRRAHEIVGRIVRSCEEEGGDLADLDSDRAAGFHPAFADADLATLLDPRAAVERRTSYGGTARVEVDRQVALLRRLLSLES